MDDLPESDAANGLNSVQNDLAAAAEFFQKAKAAAACPICNNPTWEMLYAGEDLDLRPALSMLAVRSSQKHLVPPQMPLVGFVCTNCAYVRLHIRQKVLGQ